jgi:hypothetical protein
MMFYWILGILFIFITDIVSGYSFAMRHAAWLPSMIHDFALALFVIFMTLRAAQKHYENRLELEKAKIERN